MNELHSYSLRSIVICLATIGLAGCEFGYYWQATTGHLDLMSQRRPVADVVADPETSAGVRSRIEAAGRAVDFAHSDLLLPDNGSYRSYADTGRRYVVWNVFAAPEFSLEARQWCFPVAGCVSYRGYFDEAAARKFAAKQSEGGDDIYVGGVAAYSTLGRFEDPLLNTMMNFADYSLAGLIFHELAHQRVYVQGDSKFNEGFASFVEQEGVYRWLDSIGDEAALRRYRLSLDRIAEIHGFLSNARRSLAELYDQDMADDRKRMLKDKVFSDLQRAYDEARDSWQGPPYFDHWFDAQLNNARLAASATYDDYVPAFRALLDAQGGDLDAFYGRVTELAALPAAERAASIEALLDAGGHRPSPDL